jgi:hypothetical protein
MPNIITLTRFNLAIHTCNTPGHLLLLLEAVQLLGAAIWPHPEASVQHKLQHTTTTTAAVLLVQAMQRVKQQHQPLALLH